MPHLSRRRFLGCGVVPALALAGGRALAAAPEVRSAPSSDLVEPWRHDVRISPVSKVSERHSMHTYYLMNPESPDGRRVVFFASTDPAGHVGQVCIVDRATAAETVLAENVHTEDAHRVA